MIDRFLAYARHWLALCAFAFAIPCVAEQSAEQVNTSGPIAPDRPFTLLVIGHKSPHALGPLPA